MDFDSYPKKDEKFSTSLVRHRWIPYLSTFERTFETLRPGERLAVFCLATVLIVSALVLLIGANAAVSTLVPTRGGSLTEGLVGPARFINPLLALSEGDKDLASLVYSGLMRATPEGELVPDLAATYEISDDGTKYTFTLRKGLTFHDGRAVTSADVAFTVQEAQNPDIKSTRRADWEGVVVSTPDASTVVFTLPHPYAPFLENAMLGILPKHAWEHVSADEFPFTPLNTHPIGSGPYRIKDVQTNSTGASTRYDLASFNKSALGEPYLETISFLFFANEEALINVYNAGQIDSLAGIPATEIEKLTRKHTYIVHPVLPRAFAVFFNQNKNPVLADASVRAALNAALDKQKIIDDVLGGYGTALEGPIPPGILGSVIAAEPEEKQDQKKTREWRADAISEARTILSRGGWTFTGNATTTGSSSGVWKKKGTNLEFTLATPDEPELSATAQLIARRWREAGIKVDVHVYSLSEFNTLVLRPRNYEAVLFGEVVGRTLDLFAFWHSSQRNDPGLNIAMYTNSKTDSLLSRARTTGDKREREKLYAQFAETVEKEQPAVFLYAPEFIYIIPETIKGVRLGALTSASERFLNVQEWYTDTERVWNIFTHKSDSVEL